MTYLLWLVPALVFAWLTRLRRHGTLYLCLAGLSVTGLLLHGLLEQTSLLQLMIPLLILLCTCLFRGGEDP